MFISLVIIHFCDNKMQFEIKETSKNQLTTFLKIAIKSQSNVAIIPTKDSVDFKFMEISGSTAGHLNFTNGNHISIENMVEQMSGKPFEVNIKDMLNILSHVKNQIVEINAQFDKDQELLGLNFAVKNIATGRIDKEIQIPIFSSEQRVNFGKINYSENVVNISMSLHDLIDIIEEAYEYQTEEITISLDNDEQGQRILVFNATEKDNLRKRIKVIKKEGEDFMILKNQNPPNIKGLYDIRLLKNLIQSGADYKDAIITFQENAPITINYSNEIIPNLMLIIAHRHARSD